MRRYSILGCLAALITCALCLYASVDPTLTWNTFLRGGSSDNASAIAIDSAGNIYVTGYSSAAWGTPIRAYSGNDDAYVAKLNSSGELQWSTFLGGGNQDYGYGIAINSAGNVYVTGTSQESGGSPIHAAMPRHYE